jgi:hypothetical protein
MDGCWFIGNSAEDGGGVSLHAALADNILSCRFTNCTFYGNSASDLGGGVYLWRYVDDPVLLENTIISFSTDGEAVACDLGAPSPELSCCDVYGNAGGDWVGCIAGQYGISGNIREDPLFCDPESEDFTLRVGSPCLPGHNPDCGLIGASPIGCPTTGVEDGPQRASEVWLGPCIPNPFTGLTEITYQLPGLGAESGARLSIFDPAGRLIRQLAPASTQAGLHRVYWNGTDRRGMAVQGGVYFCRLRVGDEQKTRQMLVVR